MTGEQTQYTGLTDREMEDIILAPHKPMLDQMAKEIAIEEGKYAYNLKELLALDLNVDNLLEPIIPANGLVWLQGMPDSGKSTLSRELALRVVLGSPTFLGCEIKAKHNRALCILTEESLGHARQSIARQFFSIVSEMREERKRMKAEDPSIELPPFDAAEAMKNIEVLQAHSLSAREMIELLDAKLAEKPFDMIVIDAVADVLSNKDGNNNFQVRDALKPFNAIAEKWECLILFVGHINKSEYTKTPNQAALQGAAAFAQKARLVIDLRPDAKQPGVKYLTVVKGNLVDDTLKQEALVLHWDKETHLVRFDGERVSKEHLGVLPQTGPEKTFIDWERFLKPGESITFSELFRRMDGNAPLSKRRLRDRVKEELYRSGDLYSLPKENSTMFEEPDIEARSAEDETPYMFD